MTRTRIRRIEQMIYTLPYDFRFSLTASSHQRSKRRKIKTPATQRRKSISEIPVSFRIQMQQITMYRSISL